MGIEIGRIFCNDYMVEVQKDKEKEKTILMYLLLHSTKLQFNKTEVIHLKLGKTLYFVHIAITLWNSQSLSISTVRRVGGFRKESDTYTDGENIQKIVKLYIYYLYLQIFYFFYVKIHVCILQKFSQLLTNKIQDETSFIYVYTFMYTHTYIYYLTKNPKSFLASFLNCAQ